MTTLVHVSEPPRLPFALMHGPVICSSSSPVAILCCWQTLVPDAEGANQVRFGTSSSTRR